MKEITFLKQNAQKWEAMEETVKSRKQDPARLTEMFIEVTDDLSYANTKFPRSKTSQYVNGLASAVHQLVYKNKRESGSRIVSFFALELPAMYGNYMRYLFYSFVVTSVATLIGVLSQVYDDSFVRMILGDYYVDSTIQRIRRGNALGIYGEGNQFYMFMRITVNNIRVSFVAFIFGLATPFGTCLMLVYNGVMLGAFFAMFYQYNVLDEALKVVWIHGSFEISAIIIAGSAGFILGNSYLFPGTYTRMHAFRTGATNGIKVIVGLIPVFIFAGFLESFVTRYTQMHIALSMLIIFGSLAVIIGYFIILPLYLRRRGYGLTR